MRHQANPEKMVVLLVAMVLVLIVAQLGLMRIAFYRLGLSSAGALILLLCSLAGSAFNLPLFRLRSSALPDERLLPPPLQLLMRMQHLENQGHTTIALNVGGGLIPVLFSIYLIWINSLSFAKAALAILSVTAVSYFFSRPIPGLGIGLPMLIAPICAALFAIIISPENSAPLAYIGGTLGVLIGADLLRLKDVRKMGAPLASIGGAGTFDGIYITGLIAVLLS